MSAALIFLHQLGVLVYNKNMKNFIIDCGTRCRECANWCWAELREKPEYVLWGLMAISVVIFISVMFNESVAFMLSAWFGTDSKKETLGFVWTGMAGLLAVIGAIVVNRRAREQIKTNRLIEQGHIQDRFKAATEHLGKPETQIAAYYEFCQLAEQHPELRKNIFDILCSHLRQATTDKNYKGKGKPTEQIQTLLDLLFKSEDKSIFLGLEANLQRVNLVGASLFNAHMPNTNFTYAHLINADMRRGKFNTCCFAGARMDGVWLDDAEMIFTLLTSTKLRGSRLQNTNMQMSKLGDGTDFSGSYLSNTKMQGAEIFSIPPRSLDIFMSGTFCASDYTNYESMINRRQGKYAFPDIIFSGGVSGKDVIETMKFLYQYSNKNIARKYAENMKKHINQPKNTKLPPGFADFSKYTEEDAKYWISEYKKATEE